MAAVNGRGLPARSVTLRRLLAGRRLVPPVAIRAKLIRVFEQPLHVPGIKFLFVGIVEIGADVGEVEICSILLRSAIDPIQIMPST